MYKVDTYLTGPLPTNTYVISNENQDSIIIDPGPGCGALFDVLKDKGQRCCAILITHGHSDHIDGLYDLMERFKEAGNVDIKSYGPLDEKRTFETPEMNSSLSIVGERKKYTVDCWLKDNEEKEINGMKFRCLSTPGHTEGGMSFYFPDAMCVFPGDSLFCGSIGRTDFPGGSMSVLIRAIRERLFTLPDHTKVYPGHDMMTTIETEKRENPFFGAY